MYNNQIGQSAWVQDPFNNIPFVPNISVPPEFNNILIWSTSFIVNNAQQNYQQNPFRELFYRTVSQNNYNNDRFIKTVNQMVQWIISDCLIGKTSVQAINNNPQSLAAWAEEVCRMQTAYVTSLNPHMLNNQPHEVIATIQNTLTEMENVGANIERILSGQTQQNQVNFPQTQPVQFNNFPGQQQNTFNNFPVNNFPNQVNVSSVPFGNVMRNTFGINTTSHVNHNTVKDVGPSGRKIPIKQSKVTNKILEEFGAEETDMPTVPSMPKNDFHPHTNTNTNNNVSVVESVAETSGQPQGYKVKIGPYDAFSITDDVDKLYEHLILSDGSELKPAFKSGWTKTYDPENPYGETFRLSKGMKFHLLKDGIVTEIVIEKNSDMDYLTHELVRHNGYRNIDAPNKELVIPEWDIMDRLHTLPETIETEKDQTIIELLKKSTNPVVVKESIICCSPSEAELRFHTKLYEHGIIRDIDSCYEFNAKLVTPIQVAIENVKDAFKQIEGTVKLSKLCADMKLSFENEYCVFWETLNKRLTHYVNKVLTNKMSLVGWKISSFVNNYEELLNELTKDQGISIANVLEENSKYVITNACKRLSDEEVKTYLTNINVKADNEETSQYFSDWFVYFVEDTTYIHVPWDIESIDLDINEEPALVKSSNDILFYEFVRSVFDRQQLSEKEYNVVYILTKDRKLIELSKGYLTPHTYLVNLVK